MSLINSKNIKSFYEQVQKNLVPPDIYQFNVPSTLTSTTAINEFAGITMDTYYKDSSEYISLGRRYLNFKTVILKTNFIPAEGSINPDDITTVSGYDESASAIKNITGIFGNDQVAKYNLYLEYINDYMASKTDGVVDSFQEFYKNNTSFTSNTIDYVDSIHTFTLSTKLFKYSSFVDLTNTNFILLKLDDVYIRVGNILKYNMINDLKYRDLLCYDDSKVSILCGVVYEDGTIIISSPFVLNTSTMSATNIKATCLGSLSGANKFSYTFDYNGGGSITGNLDTNQVIYKTIDGGANFSALTSGTAFPEFTVKDFSDAIVSISAALSAEAFSNITSSSAKVNWSITGASVAGYMVLRSLSAITFAPVDSITSYVAGTTASDGSMIISYTADSTATAASTGLVQGSLYNYSIIPFFGAPRAYYSPALTTTYTLLAVEPAAQATSLGTASISSTFANLVITPSGTGADQWLTRYSSAAITGDPVDATGYSVGDLLGNGQIAGTGSTTAFLFTGLTPQTLYYWQTLPFNGAVASAYNYKIDGTPATTNFYTLSTAPAATPASLVMASRSATTATLTYTSAPSVTGYLAMLKAGSSVPAPTISNATAYTNGAAMSDGSISVSSVLSSVTSIAFGSATALASDSEYAIRIISYNRLTGQNTTTNYLQTNSLTGTFWTLATTPTGQPTSIVFSNRATTSATVAWTANAIAEKYITLHKAGSVATATPVTGTQYTSGALFPSSATDYISGTGSAVTVDISSLSVGTQYFVSVMSYRGQVRANTLTPGTQNYLTTTPLTGSFWTLTSQPTAIATNGGTTSTSASISVSFTAGTPAYSAHTTLRKVSAVPDETLLVDGNVYTDGANLGSNTFSVTSGTQTVIANTGLATKTQYYFRVVSYNVGSNTATTNYYLTSYLSLSAWTLDTEPSAAPSSMVVSGRATTSASLVFTPAASTTGSVVLLKPTASMTATPVDASFYSVGQVVGDASVTAIGTGLTTALPVGLSIGTEYFYKVFSYNWGNNNLTVNYFSSSSLSGSFWTLTSEPTSIATNLAFAIPTTASQAVTFTMPSATHVMTMYKAGGVPTENPSDGQTYSDYTSTGSSMIVNGGLQVGSFSVTGLSPGTLYYYRIISQNRGSNTATTNYLTTSTSALTGSKYTQQVAPANGSINSISLVSRSTTGITTTWTKGSASGTVVMSRSTSAVDNPVQGTYYTAGTTIGSSKVSFTGSGVTSQTLSGLIADTIYWFNFVPYNEPWINYNLTSMGSYTCITLASKPVYPPNISGVSSITTTGATINHATYYPGDAQWFMTAYKEDSDFAVDYSPPVDGQYYDAGDGFQGGYIIGIDIAGQSFTYSNSAITNSKIYVRSFALNGVNSVGNLTATSNAFLTSTYSTTSFWLLATVPEVAIAVGAFCSARDQCSVTWESPTAVPTNYMVFRVKGSDASSSITALPASSQPLSSFTVGVSYSGATLVAIKTLLDEPFEEFIDTDVISRNWVISMPIKPDHYEPTKGDHLRYKVVAVQTSGPTNNQYTAALTEIEIPDLSWGLAE